jgi:hypothetical protein
MIEVIMMHKKGAPNADQTTLCCMEQIPHTNSDFIVCSATGRLSGKQSTTVLLSTGIGSNSGSLRAVLSGGFANCLATVHAKSMV